MLGKPAADPLQGPPRITTINGLTWLKTSDSLKSLMAPRPSDDLMLSHWAPVYRAAQRHVPFLAWQEQKQQQQRQRQRQQSQERGGIIGNRTSTSTGTSTSTSTSSVSVGKGSREVRH